VLPFEGRGANPARNAAVAAVRESVTLVPSEDIESAASQLGVDLATPEGMTAVASDRGVSLFVRGEASGPRRRPTVHIVIYGPEGNELGSMDDRVPRSANDRRRFGGKLRQLLDGAVAYLDQRAAEERQQEMAADRTEVSVMDDELSTEEESEPVEVSVPIIRALIGFGGRGRGASVSLTNGTQREYNVGMYPELSIYVEARPLAPVSSDLAGVYLVLDMGFGLGLSSIEVLPGGMENQIDSSALRFDGRAGYLYDLGGGEIGANVGFSYESFSLGMNQTMPSVDYPALRIGVTGRVDVMKKLVGLQLDAGLRIALGTGSIAPYFGTSAGAIGFDIIGAVVGALDIGFTYAVRFGFTGYSLSISGDGANPGDTGTGGFDGGILLGFGVGWQI
jgi:hypothetical protein